MEHKEVFSRNLKKYMELNGKSRKEVCGALGYSYFTFSDWVNGKKMPRMDKVEQIAKYFGITKSDLIEDKSEEENNTVTIGNLFENIRKDMHLSLDEISEELGLSVEEIRKYETGKGGIPANIVKRLAEYFGLSVGKLSSGKVVANDIIAAFASTNEAYVEQVTKWVETFGNERFSNEEFEKIIDYAKFILSQRKNKN